MTAKKEILSKNTFSASVESTAVTRGISFMEATIIVCEQYGIDVEEVRRFINPGLRDKIHVEASALNFLPKITQLPDD